MAWFQKALSGALTAGGDTFADVEARIDSRRKAGRTTESGFKLPPELQQPQRAGGAGAAQTAAQLEEIDENARTRFMDRGLPDLLVPVPSTGTPAPVGPPSSGRLGGTLAMTPEQSAALSARLPGPPSPRPRDLPLPPPRSSSGR